MVNHECYRIKNQIVLWYHKTEPVTHFQLIRSIRSGRAHLLYMHCCVDLEPGYAYSGKRIGLQVIYLYGACKF